VATAINNQGQVAGVRYTPYTDQQAFIWNPGGAGMQLLPMLPGAIASSGSGINKSGEVVGWSLGNYPNPVYQAFIWTPAGGTQNIGNLGGMNGVVAEAVNDSGQVVGYSTIQ
jgi:probable HAF family extracellular repeat protein